VSHFSALRTWEEMLGLPLIGDVQQAPSLLAFYGGAKAVATNTPIIPPTNTSTPIAPTSTPTVKATNTTVPTVSVTSTAINTPTPIVPTITQTAKPTNTIVPTVSVTNTVLPSPTFTATSMPISTVILTTVPSATVTNLPTLTPVPTLTKDSTASPTTPPTKTATVIALTPTLPPVTSTGQTVVNVRVTRGRDDVEESSTGRMYIDSSDLELVYNGNNQVVGIRFSKVNIPQGATITNAYLQFAVDQTSSQAATLLIQGEANPNATSFNTKRHNVSSRLRTAKSITWIPAVWQQLKAMGLDQRTPNLASIIQEIIGQPGWGAGNSLVMIITGNGKRVAEPYEIDPARAPLLHIEYTMPATSINATTVSPTITVTSVLPTPTVNLLPTESSTTVPVITETASPVPTVIVPDTQTATPTDTLIAPAP